ncbi:orexin/Hypocretin receptor type 1-like [Mya arenaria]|uniref:orexin/Hypocretin receptor type 1-like n=1 Tax=Mya arenaria TaxID=6604 RepID=UPI0022E5F640|nr:orexin/Hypocretin receptor type 1-like [Mya arenaria]
MAVLPVTIFIGMEALIGFVGNILILIIYVRRREKSNFRYFIITMACIDFTSCITALPLEAFSQLHWYTYQYPSICKLKSYCNVFTAWASASILFLLAFDRHRKIRRPLQWQIQPSFAIRLCIASIFFSAIVAIPVAILWGKQTYEYDLNGTKINVSVCEKDQAYADDIYPLLYIGTIYICPVSIMMGDRAARFDNTKGPAGDWAARFANTKGPAGDRAARFANTKGPAGDWAARFANTKGPAGDRAARFANTKGPAGDRAARFANTSIGPFQKK